MNYVKTETNDPWNRFSQIVINHIYKSLPTFWCKEEQVTMINGKETTMPVSGLGFTLNPDVDITVVDPDTGVPTGTTVKGKEAYAILYSYVLQEAVRRNQLIESQKAKSQ